MKQGYPLHCYFKTQDELEWGFTQADGEMGRRSNMGAVIAMLEGSSGHEIPATLDLEDQFRRDCGTSGQKAARRYRRFAAGLARAGERHSKRLYLVYGQPWSRTYFGGLWHLLPYSHELERLAGDRQPERWLARLCSRLANGNASEQDQRAAMAIMADCRRLLMTSVEAYRG